MSQEEAPIARRLVAEPTAPSAAVPAPGGIGADSPAAAACPLVMCGAGVLAGAAGWLVLEFNYPFFRVSDELLALIMPLAIPPVHLVEEFVAEQRCVNLQNASAAGLLMGALAALMIALVQGAARGFRRSYVPMALCVLCGGAAGAVGGLAARALLERLWGTAEPMTVAVVLQIVFWALLGGGVGAGTGLVVAPRRHLLGILCQGVLIGAIFGLIYAPLVALAFPVDDAERLVPESLANRAVWSVVGMSVLGLLLGTAVKRRPSR
jgi:hypothetical protein